MHAPTHIGGWPQKAETCKLCIRKQVHSKKRASERESAFVQGAGDCCTCRSDSSFFFWISSLRLHRLVSIMVRMQAAVDKSTAFTKWGSCASVKNGEEEEEVAVDQSVVLDRKLEDMVQYMVENGDLTLVPSDFIKPAQQRVNYSSGQKGIANGGVNHVQIPVIDMALLEDDKPKVLADVIQASEWGFLQVLKLSSDLRVKAHSHMAIPNNQHFSEKLGKLSRL